jgi:uncharacterized damage-inducible protein DinB
MALGCLEKLPEDKLNFKAHPELRTPLELFYHMYLNQDWYIKSILGGGLDTKEYKRLMNSPPGTKDGLKRYIDDVFERSQAFLRNSANAGIVCNTFEGDRTAYDLMLSDFGIQYYHLGQIFAVFRLIDLTTPDYGEMLRPKA